MTSSTEMAVKKLFDSLVQPETWADSLALLADSLNVVGCLFVARDGRTAVPYSPASHEIGGFIDAYVGGGWYLHDQTAERGWPLISSGKVVITDDDIAPEEERRHLPYYQDFRYKWKLPHWAAVAINSPDGEQRVLALLRNHGQGEFTERDIRQLSHMSADLERLCQVGDLVGRGQVTSLMHLLERLQKAACLLSWSGHVIAANQRAEEIFDSELSLRHGKLAAAHVPSHHRLEALLTRARGRPPTAADACRWIVKVERFERRPVLAQAIPLSGNLQGVFSPAVAIILFSDLEKADTPTKDMLKAVWNLSTAEARLVIELCKGRSLEKASAQLGVSTSTVRNQLKAAFEKVGVHRQSDLVVQVNKIVNIET